MKTTNQPTPKCEQQCGADADCYAGGNGAGDWAGRYCYPCQQALGFTIFDNYSTPKESNQ
jgi:hypothetical protein